MDSIEITRRNVKGLNVVHIKNSSNFSRVMLYTSIGSYCETDKKRGLAHFVEHMLFKGTETKTWEDINNIGCENVMNHNAYTSDYSTGYTADVYIDNLENTIEMIMDQYYNSTFPKIELDSERGVIMQEFEMHSRNPWDNFMDCVRNEMLNKQLSTTVIGKESTILNINRADVKRFHQKYNFDNTVLVITSSLDTDTLIKKYISKYIKKEEGDKKSTPKVIKQLISDYSHKVCLYNEDNSSAQVGFIFNVPPYFSIPVEFEFMLETLIGDSASILFTEIREKRGLCYDIGASMPFNNNHDNLCIIYASIDVKDIELYQETLIDSIMKLASTGIDEDQFRMAKVNMLDSYKRKLESPHRYMAEVSIMTLNDIDYDFITSYEERISKITLEDVNNYISDFFDEEFFNTPYYTWIVFNN